jgi:putative FmdB family regulatory protein
MVPFLKWSPVEGLAMPIYEYECLSCGYRFDELQGFSDPAVESCPKCGEKVRKLFFPPAIIFKGSGFYATEYGRSKHNDGRSNSKESSSTSSPTDTKTAASDTKKETTGTGSTASETATKKEST